jgi:hypothetical protein
MKRHLPPNLEKFRVLNNLGINSMYVPQEEGSIEGFFIIQYGKRKLTVICGVGEGWDHVSVSLRYRRPTWEEMNWIKNLFFEREETVIQLHPPLSQYVNFGKTVLHLWRPWDLDIPIPPRHMLA